MVVRVYRVAVAGQFLGRVECEPCDIRSEVKKRWPVEAPRAEVVRESDAAMRELLALHGGASSFTRGRG